MLTIGVMNLTDMQSLHIFSKWLYIFRLTFKSMIRREFLFRLVSRQSYDCPDTRVKNELLRLLIVKRSGTLHLNMNRHHAVL